MVLPQLADEGLAGLEGGVVGGDAADHLDQLHQRHRIHEMNADETLRPVGRRRQPRDRDRRGIGGDDRFRLQRRAQIGEDLALDVFLLGRGLDHESQAAMASYFSAGLMRAERGLAVVVADRLLADLPRHVAVDGRHAGLDAVARHVVQHHRIARQRADMGDAVAHLPGADHPDTLNIQRHVFVRSMRRPGSWLRFRYVMPVVPCSFTTNRRDDTTGGTANLRHGQRLTLSSSAASSGSA